MNKNNHKLKYMKAYLCGPIDADPNMGSEWREYISPKLEALDLIVIDPLHKPISIGREDIENKERRQQLINEGKFDQLADEMHTLRCLDLRLVDYSDILIVNIDTDIFSCGTIEELVTANRSKKVCLIRVKQGKKSCPPWIFGMVPHQFIFNNFDEILEYLQNIDNGTDTRHFKRWWFFDFKNMLPKNMCRIIQDGYRLPKIIKE